jgi:hypothetical protein
MRFVAFFYLLVFISVPKSFGTELYSHEEAKTKIAPLLDRLKAGVTKKDVSIFEEIILFPLNISSSETYVSDDGYVKIKTRKIENIKELEEQFDSIFVPTLVNLIGCVTPENMIYNRYKGFSAAYGAIWFLDIIENDSGIRRFVLSSLSTNETATNKWLAQACENT